MKIFGRFFSKLFILSLLISPNLYAADNEFPYREVYLKVAVIELAELFEQKDNVTIVDVRSSYEYETLHIKNALSIPLDEGTYTEKLREAYEQNGRKKMVVYCNGHTCEKSYKAALKAMNSGVKDIAAFDAGIFDWTKAYPGEAVLLGNTPVDSGKLISKEQFNAHLLGPNEFAAKVNAGGLVIDIRDHMQRESLTLFPMVEYSVPLDNARLKSYVDRAKKEGKTLLVYDAVGKQVTWLQYFLENEGLKDYYFLKGGAKDFLGF